MVNRTGIVGVVSVKWWKSSARRQPASWC